jgi:hypothetical protein
LHIKNSEDLEHFESITGATVILTAQELMGLFEAEFNRNCFKYVPIAMALNTYNSALNAYHLQTYIFKRQGYTIEASQFKGEIELFNIDPVSLYGEAILRFTCVSGLKDGSLKTLEEEEVKFVVKLLA